MEDELIRNVKNDKFAKFIGIQLLEAHEGYAVAELTLKENHFNGVNRVHGGVIFTLADYAFAAACNSLGHTTTGINVSITYFKTPVGNIIRAVATEVSSQNRICGYKVDILDENGSLIACFNGLGYRKLK